MMTNTARAARAKLKDNLSETVFGVDTARAQSLPEQLLLEELLRHIDDYIDTLLVPRP